MIQPLDNYVVLQEVEETKLESGIVLTDKANLDRPTMAIVIVCGPDAKKVEVGQTVLFKYHLFDDTTLDKKKYLIGKEEGIVAIC